MHGQQNIKKLLACCITNTRLATSIEWYLAMQPIRKSSAEISCMVNAPNP